MTNSSSWTTSERRVFSWISSAYPVMSDKILEIANAELTHVQLVSDVITSLAHKGMIEFDAVGRITLPFND